MLTTAQAATELGIGVRRVQALISAGRLAATKVGRDWLIEPKNLEKVRSRPPRGRPVGSGKKSRKKSAKNS